MIAMVKQSSIAAVECWAAWAEKTDEGRKNKVLSQSVLTHPAIPIWDVKSAVMLRGLAAAFSIKRKPSQDTFKSFPHSSSVLCFFLSLFFYTIATFPGGERNKHCWKRRGRGNENRVNADSQGVLLRCVFSGYGCGNTRTSGDVMVPAGYKPMLKKRCRSAAGLN